ncbi:Phox/Bem1p [Corchorus olitorius]|uniref:Phox/Bem1p n=1 Tax=Corchorus olitorius TaxID=93759 RepID=A0A1R3KQT8_9ROSI|nr:Phox/Bem1p [Corchorus olitorius]
MATTKIIAICQSGGEFETHKDGSLSYTGGDAHAIDIDDQMKFNDFKVEVSEMFNCSIDTMSIKYFLPGNKKTLITVSNDKDLKRMIKFHGDSLTADVYIIMEDIVAPDVSNMPASRSSRTTLSEAVPPLDPPLDVVDNIVDNNTRPSHPLGASVDGVDHIDEHMDLPPDLLPILPLSVSYNEKHAIGAQQWQNMITGVGQRFSGVHEFRESLRKYAIAHQFAFRYKKNDSHRVTVKCKAEGCPWRIHASRLSTTQLICIKKMNPTHTCEGAALTTGHQATRSWVASIIKEKLKVFPNYKPKDIVNDIKQEYGIQLNYFQAWHRQKGLRESISEIFKGSYHGYCLRYLTEQLIRDLKGQFSHEVKRLMIEDLYAAALAPKPEGFQRSIESIKSISLEAYNWIIQSEPQNWANSFFQGARYNHVTSNFGGLFYSWASDANELPITQMVDLIRRKIMELIYTRRADCDQWLTRLTPSMEEKLEKESLKVRPLQVLLTSGSIFEVRGESIEVVDMDRWDCSCKSWQLTGLPCCHTIAVISCMGRSPYDYCSRYFTTESYRLTYAESVQPIPDVDKPLHKDSSQSLVTVTPPPTRRPPGRPTTKKVGSEEVMKRQLQCSRCKGLGHNKSTCKEIM